MSTPVFDNEEVATVAGGVGGDDYDDDGDNGDDEDGDNKEEKKPSGGGIKLVPRGEVRCDHRGMASVTMIIDGDRKRRATDDSANAFGDENIGMGLIGYCYPHRLLVK